MYYFIFLKLFNVTLYRPLERALADLDDVARLSNSSYANGVGGNKLRGFKIYVILQIKFLQSVLPKIL